MPLQSLPHCSNRGNQTSMPIFLCVRGSGDGYATLGSNGKSCARRGGVVVSLAPEGKPMPRITTQMGLKITFFIAVLL